MSTLDDASADRRCPECGTRIPPGATFCPSCGHDLRGGGGSASIWIAAITAFVVGLLIAFVVSATTGFVAKTVTTGPPPKAGSDSTHVTVSQPTSTVTAPTSTVTAPAQTRTVSTTVTSTTTATSTTTTTTTTSST